MKLLRARDRVASPWKNGLGVTRAVAASPQGAGIESFDWRVSIALVDADGPFSNFPGVNRVLTILHGSMVLTTDDGTTVELDPASDPFAFAGDVPIEATILSGPVTDVNVMARRGRFEVVVEKLLIQAPTDIPLAQTTILLALTDGATVTAGKQCTPLCANDAVLLDDKPVDHVRVSSHSRTSVLVVRITDDDPAR